MRHSFARFAIAAGLRAGPVADADTLLSSTTHLDVCAVRITTESCHVGPGNTLSINPPNWHAFVQACECALPASDLVQVTNVTAYALSVAAPSCDAQGAHILVAEDHPINREPIAKQLCPLGYRVTLAEDGVVALERPHEHRFDVLLADCHMSRMDGFDPARHTRHEEGDGPRLLIIIIAAAMSTEEHTRCYAVGMDASLLKPTTLATLQEALSVLCIGDVHAGAGEAVEELPTLSLDDLHAAFGTDPVAIGLAQVFLSSLADDTQRFQPLLSAMNREALHCWAHRAGGVLALLHNPGVDAVAEAFRHVVHNGSANIIRAAGACMMRLLTCINGLLSAFGSPAADVVHRT